MKEEDAADSEFFGDLSRRNVVKAAGFAGIAGLSGGTVAARNFRPGTGGTTSEAGPEPPEPGDLLNVGGRLIAGEVGHPTIQGAYDAAADGDTVYVHSSYDAKVAQEEFPIVIDQNDKEVALVGGHPSGSEINAEHAPEANVIEIYGRGAEDYRNTPFLENLKVVGGNVGIQVVGAPNASFSNLTVFRTNSHGVHITTHDEDDTGSFGTRWYGCEAWSCGGTGFKVDADASPHGTTFMRCNATWNGWNGGHPGVELSGYSSVWQAGTIQSNSGDGIVICSGGSQVVRDTYFESNGFEAERPAHVRAEGSLGLIVDACYFLGGMLNASSFMDNEAGHDSVPRAIVLDNARTTTIQSCSHRNHGEGFVAVEGERARDNDINEASNHNIEDSDQFVAADSGERTRSHGVIREQDLRDVEGTFVGDQGIHDGSGTGQWGPHMWNGSRWVSEIDGRSL